MPGARDDLSAVMHAATGRMAGATATKQTHRTSSPSEGLTADRAGVIVMTLNTSHIMTSKPTVGRMIPGMYHLDTARQLAITASALNSSQPGSWPMPCTDSGTAVLTLPGSRGETGSRWQLIREFRDSWDNEVAYWEFIPVTETLEQQPELAGYTLKVVNC
jgi:hypothetical protein